MIEVAIIKPNNFSFDEVSYEKLIDGTFNEFIGHYITIEKIESSSEEILMANIIRLISRSNDEVGRAYKCFESPNGCTYTFYVANTKNEEEGLNRIGSFLSERHEPVIGTCVLMNVTDTQNCDISKGHVFDIIRSRFIHKAIVITPNNEITETQYIKVPTENTHLMENSSRCYQVDFLNKIFCVFIEYSPEDNRFNKYATILCRRLKVHGDVVVAMLTKLPSTEVVDIRPDTFKKILCARSNMTTADSDKLAEEAIRNNFYSVLEKAYGKFNGTIIEGLPDDILNGQTLNSTLDSAM